MQGSCERMSVAGQKRLYTDPQDDGIELQLDANQVAMSKEKSQSHDKGQETPPSQKLKIDSTSELEKPVRLEQPVESVKPTKWMTFSGDFSQFLSDH